MVDEIGWFTGGSVESVAGRLAAAAPSSLGRDGIPIADTTGAGDAFNAALLFGIATGAVTFATCRFPVYTILPHAHHPSVLLHITAMQHLSLYISCVLLDRLAIVLDCPSFDCL